jgi:hypothetical protein
MVINVAKTENVVFRRLNPNMAVNLPTLPHAQQITEARHLGVIFSHNLRFDAHINFILEACNQQSYLLQKLFIHYAAKQFLNRLFYYVLYTRVTVMVWVCGCRAC